MHFGAHANEIPLAMGATRRKGELVRFYIFVSERVVVQKFRNRHSERLRQQDYRTQSYRLVPSVHNALHTAVLYSRLLF